MSSFGLGATGGMAGLGAMAVDLFGLSSSGGVSATRFAG